MRKACRFNKLNVELVSYFTPLRLRAAYRKFQQMYRPPLPSYEHKSPEAADRWIENELKAFYWVAVAVSCIAAVPILDFVLPSTPRRRSSGECCGRSLPSRTPSP